MLHVLVSTQTLVERRDLLRVADSTVLEAVLPSEESGCI